MRSVLTTRGEHRVVPGAIIGSHVIERNVISSPAVISITETGDMGHMKPLRPGLILDQLWEVSHGTSRSEI